MWALLRGGVVVGVAGLSLGFGVVGVAWLLGWSGPAFGHAAEPPWLPANVAAGVIAVLGFLGVPAAVGHLRTEWSASAYRPLLGFTAVQVLAFGAAGVIGTSISAYVLAAGWMCLGIRAVRYRAD